MQRLLKYLFFTAIICFSSAGAADEFYLLLGDKVKYQPQLSSDCHNPDLDDSNWPQMSLRQINENAHYCVRFQVELEQTPKSKDIRLWSGMLASREIYWDGELVSQSGIVGLNKELEGTGPVGQSVILFPSQLSKGTHLISMKVSTHHHHEDLYSIFYGLILAEQKVLQRFEEDNTLASMIFVGALLLLFVLFLLLYWLYRRDKSLINFSLLCLLSAVLIGLEVIKFHYAYPWDWHVIRLRIIIVVTVLTGLSLISYYCYYYQLKSTKQILISSILILLVLALLGPSYDIKSVFIFLATMFICLGVNFYALRRKFQYSSLNLSILLVGILLLAILPFNFVEKWFAAIFSVIAIANLYSLVVRFARDREKALQSLRLESELLRRNIQPHFLMNSLMLIVEWIETQPDLAVKFVEALAEEFRLLNAMSKQKLVDLKDELNLCERHLSIMGYRYQKQLQFEVQGKADSLKIPPAVLHTLIENAFSHNRVENGDLFKAVIIPQNDRLQIKLEVPFRPRKHHGGGTGEDYIKSRLKENFSNDWKLISREEQTRWVSELIIPNVANQLKREVVS